MSYKQAARFAFATGMVSLGIVGLVYGDFAGVWELVPTSVPGRQAMAYASAGLMLVCGIGLLSRRTETLAARVLLPYLALLVLLLKLPVVVKAPLVEGSWQSMSEISGHDVLVKTRRNDVSVDPANAPGTVVVSAVEVAVAL